MRSLCVIIAVALLLGASGYYFFVGSTTPVPLSVEEYRTTSGAIAVANLEAQIDGERRLSQHSPLTIKQKVGLIDLIAMRGQMFGRIADYEEAQSLANGLVKEAPQDGAVYVARAHVAAIFHRFKDALADLDRAASLGVPEFTLAAARASIFQATAKYDQALKFRLEAVAKRKTIESLSSLASVYSELGNIREALRLFAEAPKHYRDSSPFPIAWLYFQEGKMLMRQGQFNQARDFFQNAHQRLPSYAPAQGHLAEMEAALGNIDHALELLTPLAETSDDPDYAAQLARILIESGKLKEALVWKNKAAARYDLLLEKYPEAFADHAVEFWMAAGANPKRALELAQLNLGVRKTPRAYELVIQAALSVGDSEVACQGATAAAAITSVRPWPALESAISDGQAKCSL